jgi:hypothetical protein
MQKSMIKKYQRVRVRGWVSPILWFLEKGPKRSPKHRPNIPKTSLKHPQNIPKTPPRHPQNISKTPSKHRQNILKTPPRHPQNISKTASKHRQNILKTPLHSQTFLKHRPNIFFFCVSSFFPVIRCPMFSCLRFA